MFRTPAFFALAASAAVLSAASCKGGPAADVRSDQQLQTRKDGRPTGDGTTCSWTGTALLDAASSKESTPPSSGPFDVGETFPSLDGCNECTCSARGIACTARSCRNSPAPADAGVSCEAIASAAASELKQVIANNQACAVDSDCTTVWRNADCFDQCADALATSGQGALKATKDKLNTNQCKRFLGAGCKLIAPPCVPPGQPRCSSGKCTLSP